MVYCAQNFRHYLPLEVNVIVVQCGPAERPLHLATVLYCIHHCIHKMKAMSIVHVNIMNVWYAKENVVNASITNCAIMCHFRVDISFQDKLVFLPCSFLYLKVQYMGKHKSVLHGQAYSQLQYSDFHSDFCRHGREKIVCREK